jgi:putative ubiquitin-RnfH superfamily antitoxin RatB of RatAB toxin-antitoxin module
MRERMMNVPLAISLTRRTKANTMGTNYGIKVANCIESGIYMTRTGIVLISCKEGIYGSNIRMSASGKPL